MHEVISVERRMTGKQSMTSSSLYLGIAVLYIYRANLCLANSMGIFTKELQTGFRVTFYKKTN